MIIGQKKLLSSLSSFNLDNFPRSLLLVGEKGSGKHVIADYIAKNILNLPLIDISEIISEEIIDNIYLSANPSIYFINVDIIPEKSQNTLLKLLEEPLLNTYLILSTENKNYILNTVINRCMCFEMDKYSDDELINFSKDPEALKIMRTPGKLLSFSANIKDINTLVDKICDKIKVANYANTLTLVNKFNYSDEYSKIDVDIFINILVLTLFKRYKDNNDINMYKMYLSVVDESKKLVDKRLNKQIFIEHLLTKLWKESRNG